jgi:hypothetical protein
MNFMINVAYEKSTWYQTIGLEEPIAQATKFYQPSLLFYRTV